MVKGSTSNHFCTGQYCNGELNMKSCRRQKLSLSFLSLYCHFKKKKKRSHAKSTTHYSFVFSKPSSDNNSDLSKTFLINILIIYICLFTYKPLLSH